MRYRELGNTGLQVSEIGLGAEWLERHTEEEVKAVIQHCESYGINILDCWMSNQRCALRSATLSVDTGRSGSSKGISAPPGRRGSMSVPGTCPR